LFRTGTSLFQNGLADCIFCVQGKLTNGICASIFCSPGLQIVRKQISTDKKLLGLIATMEHIYTFVDIIQTNISEKVNVLAETIQRIFSQVNIYCRCDEIVRLTQKSQTIECAIFIREYTNHGFAGNNHEQLKNVFVTNSNILQLEPFRVQ